MNSVSETQHHTNPQTPITATLVADHRRLNFLPRHFKGWMLIVENAVYDHMLNLCSTYRGAYWAFYDLSNGGCYMAPRGAEYLLLAPNGHEATVDGDTAGMIATLYALSHLSFEHPTKDIFAQRFHELRDFALDHPNSRAIFAIID